MRVLFLAGAFAALTSSALAQAVPPPDLINPANLAPYPASDVTDIMARNAKKMDACGRLAASAKPKMTVTAQMHCSYDGFIEALRAVGASDMDVMTAMVTGEFAIADRIDRKKISFTEGQAEEAALMSRIGTEAQLRFNAAQQAATAEQAARSAQAQQQAQQQRQQQTVLQAQVDAQAKARQLQLCEASGWLQRSGSFAESMGNAARARAYCEAGLPPPAPPPPRRSTTTNCMPFGDGVTCTTQ